MKRLAAASLTFALSCFGVESKAADLFVEAENFQNKGGWVVDQQFMDLMGSPYLMAHGLGKKVNDASTSVNIAEKGTYYVYVRTYNWTSPWTDKEGPGKFRVKVNGKRLVPVGTTGKSWMWQAAGKINLKKGESTLALEDMTGFNGRCDAIYMTTEKDAMPPAEMKELTAFRRDKLGLPAVPKSAGKYDLVVVGGGIAGISAAVSAARLGCKVALINDRPVLGGNNSAEIRVHLGGRIDVAPYNAIGNLQKEFGHTRAGNAKPADYYEDDKKQAIVDGEKNITLFANTRAVGVQMNGSIIQKVYTQNIETGEELSFDAPLFTDCTGDGTIGFLAGADFRMGRESKDEFGESTAPEVADKMTMGSSVQWYSEIRDKKTAFPTFKYGIDFNENNYEKVTMGEWTWENGMNKDQIKDFEYVRDYGMLVVFSNWSFLKNELKENDAYKNRELEWVAYVAGKRESRRLMGDYILKEDDVTRYITHEDASASTTWSIDLHYPDPKNTKNFPGMEFKSIAKHIKIHPYPIPYRCFYSRNVDNLFMAGRNISVTHVALGTVRVMRTTGMMGEVVGMAAKLCTEHKVLPRAIYRNHLPELKALMRVGVGKGVLPNNQQFNQGGTINTKPVVK